MKLTTAIQGRRSELIVIEKLLSLGYPVFEAVYPDSCDCIIRTIDGLKQIQIKSMNIHVKQPKPGVNLKRRTMPYKKETVDYFIVTHPEYNDFWIIPLRNGNKYLNENALFKFLNRWELIPQPFI